MAPGAPERAGGGSDAPPAGQTAPVRGITKDSVTIGITDAASQDQALADAGIKGGTQGSNERKAAALVETLNKAGGVAGRKLRLVVYKATASSTNEASCTFFTQDREVFAVLDYGQYVPEELRACLTKRKVLLLSDNGSHFDSRDLRANRGLWPVNGFNIERKIRAYVDGLSAQGYFSPWDHQAAAPGASGEPKVGLLYYEEEFNQRQNPALRAAMAARGLKFAKEFGIRMDGGSNQAADIKAAVLRFASDGITHVLFNQEVNGGMFGVFAVNASSQRYYPRYGVSSFDFPQLVKSNIPDRKVFSGMKGIGWLPYTDVDKPAPLGAAQKACLKIYSDRGQVPRDLNEQTIMLIDCDLFFKFAKVGASVGRPLNPDAFMSAIGALGAREPCHACSGVDYSRHIDGVAAVSYLEYGKDCDCVRYTRNGIPVP